MVVLKLLGDLWLFIAIMILLVRMAKTKTSAGISARSQILLTVVSTSRIDLNSYYTWSYDNITTTVFFTLSILILIQILCIYRQTYEEKYDVFLTEILLIPCFMLPLWTSINLTAAEMSILLESAALMPQFHMIYKARQMDTSMWYYLMAMGLYKTFYILCWAHNDVYYNTLSIASDFMYILLYIVMLMILFLDRGMKVTGENITSILSRKIISTSRTELSKPLDCNDEKTNLGSKPEVEKV